MMKTLLAVFVLSFLWFTGCAAPQGLSGTPGYTISELAPNWAVIASLEVTAPDFGNGAERCIAGLKNRLCCDRDLREIITFVMKRRKIRNFCWTVEKDMQGCFHQGSPEKSLRITLHGIPAAAVEEIAAELCLRWKQESVLVFDLKKGSCRYAGPLYR